MLPIESFTTRLIEEPPPDVHVHSYLTLPPAAPPGSQGNLRQLPDWLATLLNRQGVEQLSDYQWHTLQCIQRREHVCVSAPAGSGRGTARLLALHQALSHTQQGHALLICLHKQGELKQLKRIISWNDVLAPEHRLRACIYDGDTPKTQRRKIKQTPPHLILTTPEMLHAGILAYHGGWRAFLQSLQMIVLPDLHQATGAIGIHLAHLLRRLYRLCRYYGSHPQFLTTTAPLGNLPQLTRSLNGQDCTIVTGEIRRHCPQARIILSVTGNMRAATDDLTARLSEAGLTAAILRPDDRSITETEPQTQGVVFPGLPLSWIRLHEYLARLSSYPNPSLGILILAGQTPLERYVLRYPAVYQHTWLVDLPLCFNHPPLARQHLVCAAAELALQAGERYAGLRSLSEMIPQLASARAIARKTTSRQWVARQFQPHRQIRLRFFEPTFAVIRQPDRGLITRLEPQRAFREAFAGAIYRHQGETFQVERYLADQRRIIVRALPSSDLTRAQLNAQVDQKRTHVALSTPTYRVTYGTLTYTENIRTFERLPHQGLTAVSRYALPNHQRRLQTEGIWFDFDDPKTSPKQADRMAVHTFIHAVLASIRLIVACRDTAYSAVLCQDNEASVSCLSAVIVDLQNGGNGISACLYQARNRILRTALQMLLQCDCKQSCKRCCSAGQSCAVCKDGVALDRQAGIQLLQKMVGDLVPSLDTIRPSPGLTAKLPPDAGVQQMSHDIYLSLCTRKSADDVGGWQHKHLLGLAVAVTYDTYDDDYHVFTTESIEQLVDSLRKADRVIGFNLRDFDYQVLQPYTDLPLTALPTLAILDDIQQAVGFRLGFSHLIRETLGVDRPNDSLQTLRWFQQGDWQRLIHYCRRNVELLRQLVQHGASTGSIFYCDRRSQRQLVRVKWRPTEGYGQSTGK